MVDVLPWGWTFSEVYIFFFFFQASLRANVRHKYSWTYWIKIYDREDKLEQASLVRKSMERYRDSGPLGPTEIASLHSGLLKPSKPVSLPPPPLSLFVCLSDLLLSFIFLNYGSA